MAPGHCRGKRSKASGTGESSPGAPEEEDQWDLVDHQPESEEPADRNDDDKDPEGVPAAPSDPKADDVAPEKADAAGDPKDDAGEPLEANAAATQEQESDDDESLFGDDDRLGDAGRETTDQDPDAMARTPGQGGSGSAGGSSSAAAQAARQQVAARAAAGGTTSPTKEQLVKLYVDLGMSDKAAEAMYDQEGIQSFKELQHLTPKRLKPG